MHQAPSRPGRRGLAASAALLIVVVLAEAGGQQQNDKIDRDPYPLVNCVVLATPLDKCIHVLDVAGREIRVCCQECASALRRNLDTWIRVIDDRIKEEQRDYYPLDTCVVDGTKLDASNCRDVVFRNRLFRVCGYNCQEKLQNDPARYFAVLNRAVVEKQKPGYPLTRCIVSGKPLGNAAVDHVVANQLVRLAGADQIEDFNRAPGKYLAQLREASKKKSPK